MQTDIVERSDGTTKKWYYWDGERWSSAYDHEWVARKEAKRRGVVLPESGGEIKTAAPTETL